MRRRCAAGLLAVLCVALLAGCGPGGAAPTPLPALLPIVSGPTIQSAGPLETSIVPGAALPGRLLFVKGGNLWLWQGESGSQLTNAGNTFHPAWSPDGMRIAYVERGESYSDLMVMPSSGGAPARLTNNGSVNPSHSYERIHDTIWAFYPAWSLDGSQIAFASQYGPPIGSPAVDYHLSLFSTTSRQGGSTLQIYAGEDGQVGRLVYASDGAIVFAYGPDGPGVALLYRYDPATGVAGPLPGVPEQSYDPVFSADGNWLAFAARDGERTDLFALSASGGAPVRLTNIGTARAPAFSPDGTLLAFLAIAPGARGFDLWVADLQPGAGGALGVEQPRQITHDMSLDADSGIAWGR